MNDDDDAAATEEVTSHKRHFDRKRERERSGSESILRKTYKFNNIYSIYTYRELYEMRLWNDDVGAENIDSEWMCDDARWMVFFF